MISAAQRRNDGERRRTTAGHHPSIQAVADPVPHRTLASLGADALARPSGSLTEQSGAGSGGIAKLVKVGACRCRLETVGEQRRIGVEQAGETEGRIRHALGGRPQSQTEIPRLAEARQGFPGTAPLEILRRVGKRCPTEQLPRPNIVGAGGSDTRDALIGEPPVGVMQHDGAGHTAHDRARRLDDKIDLPAIGVLHEDAPMRARPPLGDGVRQHVERRRNGAELLRQAVSDDLPGLIGGRKSQVEVAQLIASAAGDRALQLEDANPLVVPTDRNQGIEKLCMPRKTPPEGVDPGTDIGQRSASSKSGCGAGTSGRTRL